MHALGLSIGILVISARFIVPLAIPRFPVPGLVAALVLDAVDQTVFQLTGTEFDGYQGYDKALDVYYLTIAYASTLRNWSSSWAVSVGRFLWYYRLSGVLLFELLGWRPLLLIFPNTFEYFFLTYELIRLRRDPAALADRFVTGLAVAIWIVIKLPQEWWIHVARLDVTDQVAAHSRPAALVAIALIAAVVALLRAARQVLPPPSWPISLSVDAHLPPLRERRGLTVLPVRSREFARAAVEKTMLVTLVTSVFAQVLPGVRATGTQLLVGTATIVILNAVVSQAFARRGTGWRTTTQQFLAMAAVNLTLVIGLTMLAGKSPRAELSTGGTVFFLLLLTLIVTMVDRYQAARHERWALDEDPITPPS